MSEVTVDDVLVAWRDVMADEAQIVSNWSHKFEDARGRSVAWPDHAVCACFYGGAELAALRLDEARCTNVAWRLVTPARELVAAALPEPDEQDVDRWGEPFTPYLRDNGHTACAAAIDSVIAARRAEGGERGAQ